MASFLTGVVYLKRIYKSVYYGLKNSLLKLHDEDCRNTIIQRLINGNNVCNPSLATPLSTASLAPSFAFKAMP